ncbi:SPFH domain-containing protein [Nitrospina gracilis]|uniref:SPFH domain-containing protein n=1 Tax=Nitrospina gracilis TaxID=35801 RepID=UPI001EFF5195|nr:SPFH domain-containing protein [Nitrospina gracilis]MCF8721765.1 regulator of protease activity HflC (stomatin/prohibitin superfamily) [Nitrospina gracilis Nb-211]
MSLVEYLGILTALVIVWYFASKTFHRIVVKEYESGLPYRNGKFIKSLKAGSYWIIGWASEITKVDLRIKTETVPGQEVMSQDNISLKVSLGIKYVIEDAEKATHLTESFQNDLYQSVQLALRAVVGSQKIEDLLTNRSSMGTEISKSIIPEAEKIGLKVHWVEVKDIMFPGELKKVFAEEIKARKEGLALLERARGGVGRLEESRQRHKDSGKQPCPAGPAHTSGFDRRRQKRKPVHHTPARIQNPLTRGFNTHLIPQALL